MKKTLAIVLVLALLCGAASAEMFGGLMGGITSLFGGEDGAIYGVGEPAELSAITVTLTDVMESKGSKEYKPADGNEYLIFEFKIKNNSSEAVVISSMMCFSGWCDNKSYSLSLEGLALSALSGKLQFDRAIDPGKTEKGVVAYEVPKGWQSAKVQFNADGFGGDSCAFVVEK